MSRKLVARMTGSLFLRWTIVLLLSIGTSAVEMT
jgi:hypothetical protein